MTEQLHMQVGILMGDEEARTYLAQQWGKEGTSSDITLYTSSSSSLVQTSIIPNAYPKKPLPLVFTAHLSDTILLGVPATGINALVGEAAILADCLGLRGIQAVVGKQVMGLDSYFDQMDNVFSKLSIKKWEKQMIYNGSGVKKAREKLTKLHDGPRGSKDEYLAIEIDHAFPVQGVGSVILGTVVSGTVEKGQKIKTIPGNQQGVVRSIQVNDEDVRVAYPGVHVGMAMKGILPKFLQRGTVITSSNDDSVMDESTLTLTIKSAIFGELPSGGDRVHIVSGLFDAPGEIVEWGNKVTLDLDKSVPFHDKTRFTIMDLNKKPVIMGSKYK